MKSKIMVDHDLEKNEPFIQLTLSNPDDSDLTDKILRHFVDSAQYVGIEITNGNNLDRINQPRIILAKKQDVKIEISVTETSQEFRDWLDTQDIPFSVFPGHLIVEEYVDLFNLGVKWGELKHSKIKQG